MEEACHGICGEVRGQLCDVDSLLYIYMGSGVDQTQEPGLCSKCLYPLSHHASPSALFLKGLRTSITSKEYMDEYNVTETSNYMRIYSRKKSIKIKIRAFNKQQYYKCILGNFEN